MRVTRSGPTSFRGVSSLLLIVVLLTPVVTTATAKQIQHGTQPNLANEAVLEITKTDRPETIERGVEYMLAVQVHNPSDESITRTVFYQFEGQQVFSKEVTVDPGGRTTVTLQFTLDMIKTSVSQTLEDGTYTHSFVTEGGAVDSAEVRVISSSSGSATATARTAESKDTAPSGATTEDRPERGFFTNGASRLPIVSDMLNLTVLGFLLSVAGIVHQLLSGA